MVIQAKALSSNFSTQLTISPFRGLWTVTARQTSIRSRLDSTLESAGRALAVGIATSDSEQPISPTQDAIAAAA
jgi:hypothetical protein